ncbi:hypothetical protein DXG01_007368 [Tephrocybe rancida]|nr:hypothetical protein DXG01_007368 [Tephrocybe rancida]
MPSLYLVSLGPHKNSLVVALISLLHHLSAAYPSQGTFRQFFDTIPAGFLPRTSAAFKWITGIAKSLRTQNYATFDVLSNSSNSLKLFERPEDLSGSMNSLSLSGGDSEKLSRQALLALTHSLRNKAQLTTWGIIRSAYRELLCNSEETQIWLERSLCLQSAVPYGRDITPEQWLEQHSTSGHTRLKEGVQGKWLIYKVRQ